MPGQQGPPQSGPVPQAQQPASAPPNPFAPQPGAQPPSAPFPAQPAPVPQAQPAPPQQPGQPPANPFGQPGQQAPANPFGGQPGGAPPFGASPFPGQAAPAGGQQLAHWGQRVGAYLIDMGPMLALVLIGGLVMFASITFGTILMVLGWLGGIAWNIFNRWIQAGNTGQSLGKKMVGIKLVGEQTGQPIGAGQAFLRDLCHALDNAACSIGYLWPLWDEKSQTFADKILKTVVVVVPKTGMPPGPGFGQQQPYGAMGQQPGFGQSPPAPFQ
ncbi:RDD family protein [Amycolatopsis suaedae]|uniref:RDD family protein n=2 Tax=Amycolatopsis suaedae TaxID=2510978 RepID=A0A4V2EL64_9PSEU|nr:RDD family protein [Amycolatopsis suaedae]